MPKPTPPRAPMRGPRTRERVGAIRALNAGDYQRAARGASAVLATSPDDADMLRVVGVCASNLQQSAVAIEMLTRACELAPDDPLAHASLASALHHAGDDTEALGAIDRAVALDPGHPVTCAIAASIHRARGDKRAARAALASALVESDPDPSVLVLFADLADETSHDDATARLERAADRGDINPVFREQIHNRLAKLYDRAGRHDDAWAQLALQHGATEHAPRAIDADAVIETWTREACAALPRAARSGQNIVLVTGMPRSGTTLTESIIAAHPLGAGIGESPMLTSISARIHRGETSPAAIESLASDYHAGARRAVAQRTPADAVIADKMPSNLYMLHAACAVLPGCRVVRCRRDPRDVLLSCLFQNFHNRNTFAKDPVACAQQIIASERIDAHWREVLDLDIIDIEYADTIADVEATARELVGHAGLDWDDACLRFHESDRSVRTASVDQVRKPIYASSVGKWERYEQYLMRAIELMRDAGVLHSYD